MKFMDLTRQNADVSSEIKEIICDMIDRSEFIGGEQVKLFEKEFAEFVGVSHCVGCGNGTDALEIALEALELPENAEILVPSNSFIASSEAVTRSGYRVKFTEVDPETLLITKDIIKANLTSATAAVICVNLYGNICDFGSITEFCTKNNIRVIEDCAQSHGASFDGQQAGSFGDISAFSFYPGKNLGAYGDAGCVVTNSESLAIRSRMIANHGRVKKYDHEFEGRNSRLDSLQAAVLRVKLKYLDTWTTQRIRNAAVYNSRLSKLAPIRLQKITANSKHVYHLFVVRIDDRVKFSEYLNSNKIGTGIHYPILLPNLNAYAYLDNPFSDDLMASTLLSLPVGEHLVEDDIGKICDVIERYYGD